MKNFNIILTKKLGKYQHYHQIKLTYIYEYLTGEDILTSDKSRIIEQAKCTFFPLEELWKNKQKQWKTKE